jgi:hypothetical protein
VVYPFPHRRKREREQILGASTPTKAVQDSAVPPSGESEAPRGSLPGSSPPLRHQPLGSGRGDDDPSARHRPQHRRSLTPQPERGRTWRADPAGASAATGTGGSHSPPPRVRASGQATCWDSGLGSPQASGGVRIPLRGDSAGGHGDPTERLPRQPSPDLLGRSPGISSGASMGHVSHPISTSLCSATPVAAPTHLYYPAGTMAPGPVLTSLPSHADIDRNLHRHGMVRGILSDVSHLQTHSDVQDQAGGNPEARTPPRHLHSVPATSTSDQAMAPASRAPRTP